MKEIVEHPLDRDLDNDGIPDMWVDKGRMHWKNKHYKEIWDRYTTPDPVSGKPKLDEGVILVEILKVLEEIRDERRKC